MGEYTINQHYISQVEMRKNALPHLFGFSKGHHGLTPIRGGKPVKIEKSLSCAHLYGYQSKDVMQSLEPMFNRYETRGGPAIDNLLDFAKKPEERKRAFIDVINLKVLSSLRSPYNFHAYQDTYEGFQRLGKQLRDDNGNSILNSSENAALLYDRIIKNKESDLPLKRDEHGSLFEGLFFPLSQEVKDDVSPRVFDCFVLSWLAHEEVQLSIYYRPEGCLFCPVLSDKGIVPYSTHEKFSTYWINLSGDAFAHLCLSNLYKQEVAAQGMQTFGSLRERIIRDAIIDDHFSAEYEQLLPIYNEKCIEHAWNTILCGSKLIRRMGKST